MAGFNLVNKTKNLQNNEYLKNLNALNSRANQDGQNNMSSEGFDITGTAGLTYDLEAIENSKNRSSTSELIIENVSEITESEEIGTIKISTDDSKKINPTSEDYKKYLLDD